MVAEAAGNQDRDLGLFFRRLVIGGGDGTVILDQASIEVWGTVAEKPRKPHSCSLGIWRGH